jgi:hypothetical protein
MVAGFLFFRDSEFGRGLKKNLTADFADRADEESGRKRDGLVGREMGNQNDC